MSNLLKRVSSLVLAFAVMLTCVPFSVFAACNHTPNTDAGGNVIWYVFSDDHVNKCSSCGDDINIGKHVNNGNDECTVCGVSLDAGTARHTHVTNGQYGHKDPVGHTISCADQKCVGVFETHTNMNGIDTNSDGTADCDYCGWDGVIIGKGGGGLSCTHANIRYDISESSHTEVCGDCGEPMASTVNHINDGNGTCSGCGVTVDANNEHHHDAGNNPWTAIDSMEHEAHCAGCSMMLKGQHGDDASNPDGLCDMCGYGTPISCQHTPIIVNGVYHYATEETTVHKNICAQCFAPYNPVNHSDSADADNCCDTCGVEVDSSNEHHHNMETNWNAGIPSHFHRCLDGACNYTEDDAPHSDNYENANPSNTTPDGLCDVCGYNIVQGGQPSNQPRFDWNFSNGSFMVPINGRFTIGILDGNRPTGTTVDVLLGYVDHNNNGAFVPYNDQSGLTVTRDSNGIATAAEFDGAVIYTTNQLAMNNGYFHVAVVVKDSSGAILASDGCDVHLDGYCNHQNNGFWMNVEKTGHQTMCGNCGQPVASLDAHTDSDSDNICDGCPAFLVTENGVLVHNHSSKPNNWFGGTTEHFYQCDSCGGTAFNQESHKDTDGNSECDVCLVKLDANGEHHCDPADLAWVAEDESQHKRICTDCRRIYEQTAHEDTDNDDKCDKCFATLDANDIHIHQPDGNWTEDGPNEHCCECTECEGWAYEPHDDADNDGFCDDCNRDLTCYHTRFLWYATDEETHQLHCGDCGQSVAAIESHNDSDGDGKCDVCKVEVIDNIHTHVWDTNWTPTGATSHFHNCTDINCTTSTDSIAHDDSNGDGACDDCGNTDVNDWCQQHVHNGDYIVVGDKHYTMCGNCYNGFGTAENHRHAGDYVVDGGFHKSVCGDCGAEFDPQPHSGTNYYDTDDEFHRAICDYCGEVYGNDEPHHGVNGFESDQWTHRPICADCGVPYGPNEVHNDVDMDNDCDICNEAVTHNESGDYREVNNGHAKYCTECDNIILSTIVPHNPDVNVWVPFEDVHAHPCMDCMGRDESTKAPHNDTDGNLHCDDCGVEVDANGVHHHNFSNWDCMVDEHVKYCESCGYGDITTAGTHADVDTNGRCDGCNATLDGDNKHYHTEKYEYSNNTVHTITCTGCDSLIGGGDHSDNNGDKICDECNGAFVRLNLSASSSVAADFKSALEKAVNQGNFSALKAITEADDDYLDYLVDIYKDAAAAGITPVVNTYIYQEVATKTEIDADTDLKAIATDAEALIENGKTKFIFSQQIFAEIDLGDNYEEAMLSVPAEKITLDIEDSDVESNRTWYVMSTNDLVTFTKTGESAKGASSVSFATGVSGDICVLLYVDEATTEPEPTPTPTTKPSAPEAPSTSTPIPAPTIAPVVTPAPTVAPTVTPEPTEEPVEMPKEADTTIVNTTAKEEVIEAAKETVTVTEGVATVDKAAVEAIVEATTEETTVVIPLAQTTEEVVNKAEINTDALASVADAEKDIVIELTDATVKLDAKAVQAIAEQADGETIEIRVVKADTNTLTSVQQKKLKEMDTAIVVSAQIFSDGEYIGKFKGGKATVMLPFEIEEGRDAKDYKVYYIDENGDLKKVASEYVNGHMVFTTAHFSDYAIVYEGEVSDVGTDVVTPQTPVKDASFPVLPIIIAVIAAMVIVIIVKNKKKNEE